MSDRVPKDWTPKKLGDVTIQTKGLTYKSEDYGDENSGVPFLTLKSISKSGGYSPLGLKFYKGDFKPSHLIESGNILFANTDLTRDGDVVGSPIYFDGSEFKTKPLFSMDLSKLVVDSSETNGKFLYYLLMTDRVKRFMINASAGSTVLHLDTKNVKSLPIILPPLPEQKKIASILTSVDDVMENTQKQIDKLQELKRATMNELLTKGIGHTDFKDSDLGRIPKCWDLKKLIQCVDKIVDCEHKTAPKIEKSDFFVVSTNAVKDGELIDSNLYNTPKIAFENWTARAVPAAGDVMFTREAPAGESCCVPKNKNVCLGQRMVLLRPNLEILLGEFLNFFLCSDIGKSSVYEKTLGTTVSRINMSDINNIIIPLPSISEQARIASIIGSISSQIKFIKHRKFQYMSLKKSLMQNLITGKTRVKLK